MRGGYARPTQEFSMPPMIDPEKCVKCGTCADICPLEVYGRRPARGEIPAVRYPDECWHCNVCVMDCPSGALSLRLPISHMILHLDSPYLQTLSKEDGHAAH